MNDHFDEHTPVTRQLVPEDQRLAVVEQLFGIHFPLRLEPVIYGITEKMTQGAYCGGYWLFYRLSDGGFYMAPDNDQIFEVCCDNYWKGELSGEALGITACLYAYSHLSFSQDLDFGRTCAQHYHKLREYMFSHPEAKSICGAID